MTEEIALLRRSARRFLSDHASAARTRHNVEVDARIDRAVWREMGTLGWLTIATDEDEIGVRALATIVEEMGRVVSDQPVLVANIVARAVARGGSSEQRDRYLAPLAAGELVASTDLMSAASSPGAATLEATRTSGCVRLSGDALVERGDEADLVLVTARTSDDTRERFLVPAGTPGLRATRLTSLDLGRRYARLSFDGVELDAGARIAGEDADAERMLAVALMCAESFGAAASAFEMTLAYMRTRVVFGRILGSYQVVKHRLTDMSLWLETSRAVAEAAVDAVATGDPAARELTSVAKAYVSEKTPLIGRDCVQLHGGIGFTWEHDVHLFLRRIEANAIVLGDVGEHLRRVADLVIDASGRAIPETRVAAS